MIYLDYNATTPLCAPAWRAMQPYFQEHFGNPSSVHRAGRETRAAIDEARDGLAALLKVRPHELIFTSGGTESCNLALLGLARRYAPNGKHLISNRAEHHAVLHTLEHLEKREGFAVTWLDVSSDGLVDPDQLTASIRPDTTLVSIMTANNETGVIQPIEEIAARCHARGVRLHSDMVQSLGKVAVIPNPVEGSGDDTLQAAQRDPTTPLRFAQDDRGRERSIRAESKNAGAAFDNTVSLSLVDAASFAAHKFHGPKGVGLLYLRAGLPIDRIQFGGAHEGERRPGTENVPAIVGMGAAAAHVLPVSPNEQARQARLRADLWTGIASVFPAAQQNGAKAPRLANTLNVSFPGFTSETLLMALDLEDVCASSGSACMVGSVVASHVLSAMGMPPERAGSAIRFSLGKETSAEEIAATIAAFERIIARKQRRAAVSHEDHAFV